MFVLGPKLLLPQTAAGSKDWEEWHGPNSRRANDLEKNRCPWNACMNMSLFSKWLLPQSQWWNTDAGKPGSIYFGRGKNRHQLPLKLPCCNRLADFIQDPKKWDSTYICWGWPLSAVKLSPHHKRPRAAPHFFENYSSHIVPHRPTISHPSPSPPDVAPCSSPVPKAQRRRPPVAGARRAGYR